MFQISSWRTYFRETACKHPSLRLIGWSKFRQAEPLALPPHHHGHAYEIHYLRRGRLDVILDNKIYSVRAGQAVITKPFEVHGGVQSALQKCEFLWTQLHAEKLDPDMIAMLDECADRRVIRVRSATGERLQTVLDYHTDDRRTSGVASVAMMSLFACELFESMNDEYVISAPIREAIRLMQENLAEPPRLDFIAGELGVSTSHLSATFREEVGETPGKWFLHERLDAACRLLEEGRSTRDIARDLGYSTPQNFATSFRRELGLTPTEYRSHYLGLSEGPKSVPFWD